MKRKGTKLLGLAMAAVLTLGMTACGGDGGNKASEPQPSGSKETQQSAEKSPSSDASEVTPEKTWTDDDNAEITILMVSDVVADENNEVLKTLEEKTGTKIRIILVSSGDYDTKLRSMISADSCPDIFSVKQETAAAYKEAGVIANAQDVLEAVAPNVIEDTKDILHEPAINKDGVYIVPCPQKGNVICCAIRTDWLKNLNLEMPTDLDSFAKVMHAFTYDDPDGNGKKDTYGYAFNLASLNGGGTSFQNIFGAYGIPKGQPIELADGTVTTWAKHPQFLDAIRYIRGLIADGVCEPDYVTIPNADMFNKVWTGVAGCIEWSAIAITNNWVNRYTEDPMPTWEYAVIKGPEGQFGASEKYPDVTQGWAFSASCKNLEGAARIANYCMSEEGSDLLTLGIEGVMYKWADRQNGKIEYIEPYTDSATHRSAGGYVYATLFKPSSNAEFRTLNEQTRQATMDAWTRGIAWPYILQVSEVRNESGADMDQILNEMVADLLTTDESKLESTYQDYISEWESTGGKDWEEEATALWKEQNK